jgi:hypothetical protein
VWEGGFGCFLRSFSMKFSILRIDDFRLSKLISSLLHSG